MNFTITSLVISGIVCHFKIYAPYYGKIIPTFIITKAITKWVETLGEEYKIRNSLLNLTGNLITLNVILDIPLAIKKGGFFGEKHMYNKIFDLINDYLF